MNASDATSYTQKTFSDWFNQTSARLRGMGLSNHEIAGVVLSTVAANLAQWGLEIERKESNGKRCQGVTMRLIETLQTACREA